MTRSVDDVVAPREITVDGEGDLDYSRMSMMEQIAVLDDADRERVLADMSEVELTDPRVWLRPQQLEVIDDSTPIVVAAAGRGWGKSRVGASWVIEKARVPGTRIHLVGRTVSDVRDVMVQGDSGIMACSPVDFVPDYMPSVRRVIWPNGSIATTFSSESPDSLRGPQADFTWADELGTFKTKPDSSGATTWDNILISTRLGAKPQILVTTTPRRTKHVKQLFKDSKEEPQRVSLHLGSTLDNRANLSVEYIDNVVAMFAGTALEAQELHGVLVDQVAGAMWRDTDFHRAQPDCDLVDLVTVIGVDPNLVEGGDSTGIVTCRGTTHRHLSERLAWVVRDDSEDIGLSPERWAQRVLDIWREESEKTGRLAIVVAEKNAGGELVSTVIHQLDGGRDVPIALVSAKGSKMQRAESVVLPYRRGRVFHAAESELELLEEELTTWEEESKWSPGRLDAMVHALRSILVDDTCLRAFGPINVVGENVVRLRLGEHRRGRLTEPSAVAGMGSIAGDGRFVDSLSSRDGQGGIRRLPR